MNEEQLLQEARKEAEKVYPKLWDKLCIEAFINGYVANAKKQMSEVREFKERLIKAITSDVMFDDGYDSILAVQNVIEKLK